MLPVCVTWTSPPEPLPPTLPRDVEILQIEKVLVEPPVLQQLRSLARQARAEQSASRPPAASRQLFRRLRESLPGPES
jgi:hypothetical protein